MSDRILFVSFFMVEFRAACSLWEAVFEKWQACSRHVTEVYRTYRSTYRLVFVLCTLHMPTNVLSRKHAMQKLECIHVHQKKCTFALSRKVSGSVITHTCMHIRTQTCAHTYMYMHGSIHTHALNRSLAQLCGNMFIHTCVHTYTHTCTRFEY